MHSQQRDRAYETFAYHTIGQLLFLNLHSATHPQYKNVLNRLQSSGHKLLDVGCCFGQEMRKLVYDGAPAELLYGIDIEPTFISLGYELFKDHGKLQSTFIVGDIFDLDLDNFRGEIDIVLAKAFFHLFSWEQQVLIGQLLVSLLKSRPGSMVFGMHLGSVKPGEYKLGPKGPMTFRHSPDTLAELWREAAGSDAESWKVESSVDTVTMEGHEHAPWAEPNMRRIVFTVVRQ